MKIKSINKYYNLESGSYIYTDFYEKSNEKVALILKASNNSENLKETISQLIETFQKKFYFEEADIEEKLENTFLELHWKVASVFHKKKNTYNISALLLVVKNQKIYVVQAGRLSVIQFHERSEFIGLGVKQLIDVEEPLNMLGEQKENINYKVFSKELKPNTEIIALPVFSAKEFINIDSKKRFFDLINKLDKQQINPVFTFSIPPKREIKASKIYSLSMIFSFRVLVIVVILASFYALLGKKWIQGWISSGKEYFNEKKVKNIDIDRILSNNQALKFSFSEKFPELEKVTLKPYFDATRLFIISKNKIVSLHKNNYKLEWENTLNNPIANINLLRNNMMMTFDNEGKQYLINRTNGEIIWQKSTKFNLQNKNKEDSYIFILDYIKDGRLNKNYYVTAHDSVISLYSANSNELVTQKKLAKKFDFISAYDYIKKCFYLVQENEIVKLDLVIE